MKRVSLISTVFVGLTFTCGCMTSRSRCDINYENDSVVISSASEVTTSQKYAIREIRGNSCPSAIDDSVMGEVVGTISSAERIMHTCPGVFERNGEEIFVDNALGRVLADVTVSCPPAVPILVSGEVVSEEAINAFKYYGTKKIKVIKNKHAET